MPIPAFTSGYPPDGSSLGQTKATIRNNLDGTFQTLAVDHIDNNGSPGSNPAGYHKIIHEVTQTNVTTVTGVNQIFSGVPGTLVVDSVTTDPVPPTDTQLFSLTGDGVLSQLTGKRANNRGYCWAGGILFQWGRVSTTGTYGTVTFTASSGVNFPNNIFTVQLTSSNIDNSPITPGTPSYYSIKNGSLTTSSFSYLSNNANAQTLHWFAIGN